MRHERHGCLRAPHRCGNGRWRSASVARQVVLSEAYLSVPRVLLGLEKKYFIFDINRKELKKLALSDLDKIIWDDNDGQKLWYLKKDELFTYQPDAAKQYQSEKIALSYPLNDFDVKDNWLISHHSQLDQNFVSQIDLNDFSVKQITNNVNVGKVKLFLANNEQLIFAVGSQLYIKTKDSDLISIPFTNAAIHDQRILLTNGYEIILYNFTTHPFFII
jgi:hypothetical protein